MIRTLILLFLLPGLALAQDTDVSDLTPGDHTWGIDIEKPKDYFWGKVTFLVIADGAGLDTKLMTALGKSIQKSQGKPFALVVADADGKTVRKLEQSLHPYLDLGWQNWSLTDSPKHPKLAAKTYPHYVLFNHNGKLVSQGTADKKAVGAADKLLRAAPKVYVGHEPYKLHGKIARRVEGKSGFPGPVLQIQQMMKGADGDSLDELERIYNSVSSWRDRQIERLTHLRRWSPVEAMPHIDKVFQEMLGAELEVKIEKNEMHADKDHPKAVAIGKVFAKLRATYRKKIGKAKDAAARKKVIDPLAKKARKLADPDPSLPVARAIEKWLESIGAD